MVYLGEVLVLDKVHYILVLFLRLRGYTVGPGCEGVRGVRG